MDQHREIEVTYTTPRWDENPGAEETTTMLETQFAPGRRVGERWYQCPVCLEELPESEVVWVGGRAYCPQDAEDILIDEQRRR